MKNARLNELIWRLFCNLYTGFSRDDSKSGVLDSKQIAQIAAQGTSNSYQEYAYFHKSAEAGTHYYELVQVDLDGSSNSYPVISLNRNESVQNDFDHIQLYPIPASDWVSVEFGLTTSSKVDVSIYDVTGQLIMTRAIDASQGINTFTLDVRSYPVGIYFVQLQQGKQVANVKLVVE